MRSFIIFILFFTITITAYPQKGGIKKINPLKLKADSIVSILYTVLQQYSNEVDSNLPGFREATVVLESTLEGIAGGGIDVAVFEAGVEASKTKSMKTSFEIASAKSRKEMMIAIYNIQGDTNISTVINEQFELLELKRKEKRELNFSKVDLTSELLKALRNAATEYSKMILRDNESYKMNSFEIELSFGIRYTADSKLNFSLFGVGGNIGGEFAKESVHTISVKYGSE